MSAKPKPLPTFTQKRTVKEKPPPLAVAPEPRLRKVPSKSRPGYVRLAGGGERGRIAIYCEPALRRELLQMAAAREVRIGELAAELLSEAVVRARRA